MNASRSRICSAFSALSRPGGIGETAEISRLAMSDLPISTVSGASGLGLSFTRSSSSLSRLPVTCVPSVRVTVMKWNFSSTTFEGSRMWSRMSRRPKRAETCMRSGPTSPAGSAVEFLRAIQRVEHCAMSGDIPAFLEIPQGQRVEEQFFGRLCSAEQRQRLREYLRRLQADEQAAEFLVHRKGFGRVEGLEPVQQIEPICISHLARSRDGH